MSLPPVSNFKPPFQPSITKPYSEAERSPTVLDQKTSPPVTIPGSRELSLRDFDFCSSTDCCPATTAHGGAGAETESSLPLFTRQLPAAWHSISISIPSISQLEANDILLSIDSKKKQLTDSELRLAQSNDLSPMAALIADHMLRMTKGALAQNLAKLSHYYFLQQNDTKGQKYFVEACQIFEELTESKWEILALKILNTLEISKSDSGKHLNPYDQIVATYTEYAALLKMRISLNDKFPLDHDLWHLYHRSLLACCGKGIAIQSNHSQFHLLKIGCLAALTRSKSDFDRYIATIQDAKKTVPVGDPNYQFLQSLEKSVGVEGLSDPELWKLQDAQHRRFYLNVIFEDIFMSFKNSDLTKFNRDFVPENLFTSTIVTFNGASLPVSISDIYRFIAHFRNITVHFEFVSQKPLNKAIYEVLNKRGMINAQGFILLDRHLGSDILNLVKDTWRDQAPDSFSEDDFDRTVTIDKIYEFQNTQQQWLQATYDGFPSELALFLAGVTLTNHDPRYCAPLLIKKAEALIRSAYDFRSVCRQAADSTEEISEATFQHLAETFVDPLFMEGDRAQMLQVTLGAPGSLHSLFLVFKKTTLGISVLICDGRPENIVHEIDVKRGIEKETHMVGFGPLATNDHTRDHTRQNLIAYVCRATYEPYRDKTIFDMVSPNLRWIYEPKTATGDTSFVLQSFPRRHLIQVAGNCSVFAMQLGLSVSLDLSEQEETQLQAEFLTGIDVLASEIATGTKLTDDELPLSEFWEREEQKYPIGYDSGARPDKPKGRKTGQYMTTTGTPIAATEHHILPLPYLTYLFQGSQGEPGLSAKEPALVKELLGRNPSDNNTVSVKSFAYAAFNLFKGPASAIRSHDPSKTDPDPNHGTEPDKPHTFPQERWDALHEIDKILHPWLSRPAAAWSKQGHDKVLNDCIPHLQKIINDPTRTTVHSEATPGDDWEQDSVTKLWKVKK